MKIHEKRLIIEALLIAAGDANNVSFNDACAYCEVNPKLYSTLEPESYRRMPKMLVSDRYADEAYLLIESSRTLRREWFQRG